MNRKPNRDTHVYCNCVCVNFVPPTIRNCEECIIRAATSSTISVNEDDY